MKRRAAIVAAALAAITVAGSAASATADDATSTNVNVPLSGDTNGCVVVKPLLLAVCIDRF